MISAPNLWGQQKNLPCFASTVTSEITAGSFPGMGDGDLVFTSAVLPFIAFLSSSSEEDVDSSDFASSSSSDEELASELSSSEDELSELSELAWDFFFGFDFDGFFPFFFFSDSDSESESSESSDSEDEEPELTATGLDSLGGGTGATTPTGGTGASMGRGTSGAETFPLSLSVGESQIIFSKESHSASSFEVLIVGVNLPI